MNKIKVFVAGASGFIGRNTAEYLAASPEKYEVFACTDPVADLRDAAAAARVVRDFAPDCLVNCAAMVSTRKTAYGHGDADVVGTNLSIFFNLLRARRPGARFIQLGSGAEYDLRAYKPKMSEDYFDVSVPADPYGFSKYAASMYAAAAGDITVLRVFGLYGRHEDYTFKFISNAIVKNLLGLPITINQNMVQDFLYVGDFLRLLERFIERGPAHTHYNLTPTESPDLLSLAAMVNAAAEKPVEVRVLNPGLNREYTGSNARLLAEFPDFRFTPHAAAIKELYGYYRDNLKDLDTAAVKADEYLKNCRTVKP